VGFPWIVVVLGGGWLFSVVGLVLQVDLPMGMEDVGSLWWRMWGFVVAGGGRWIVDLVKQIFLFLFLFFYSGLEKKKKKNYNRKYMQTKF
jgi:hypothetical protein